MISIFITEMKDGMAVLPEITDAEYVKGKLPDGTGHTVVGYAPQDTVIVRVVRDESVITAMKADENYLWIEDIEETEHAV